MDYTVGCLCGHLHPIKKEYMTMPETDRLYITLSVKCKDVIYEQRYSSFAPEQIALDTFKKAFIREYKLYLHKTIKI